MGWMPRGISWLRVSILIAIASLMSGGLIFSGKYGQYLLFGNRNPSLFLLTLAIALVLPFIGYAYIHCWLLGNKPDGWAKKIPSPSSIKERFNVEKELTAITGKPSLSIVPTPDSSNTELLEKLKQFEESQKQSWGKSSKQTGEFKTTSRGWDKYHEFKAWLANQ